MNERQFLLAAALAGIAATGATVAPLSISEFAARSALLSLHRTTTQFNKLLPVARAGSQSPMPKPRASATVSALAESVGAEALRELFDVRIAA